MTDRGSEPLSFLKDVPCHVSGATIRKVKNRMLNSFLIRRNVFIVEVASIIAAKGLSEKTIPIS